MKTNTVKRTNVTKQLQPIMHRLQKYTQGYQGLAVLSGVLGQTAICSASVVNLNLDGPNVNETFISDGSGSAGSSVTYLIDSSTTDIDDQISFFATLSRISVGTGINGALLVTNSNVIDYLSYGSVIDSSSTLTAGSFYITNSFIDLGPWTVDRTGAIGFKTGDD